MELTLLRTPQGFIPATDAEAEKCRKVKLGATVRADIAQMRNYKFLQKMHCLYQLAYDHFTELCEPLQYKGEDVRPSYDRFRYDLTILAGHYTPVYAINGEVRLEAKSISYGKCSEEEAEKIFSDVINAALKFVYKHEMSEEKLRELVDKLISFS